MRRPHLAASWPDHTRTRLLLPLALIAMLAAAFMISPAYHAHALAPCTTTCYVNANTGNDANSGSTPGDAFATIQAAVDQVQDYGTVIVSNGTYNEAVEIDHPLTLKGYKAGWDGRYRTPSFGGESIITAGTGGIEATSLLIDSSDVTVDGFEFLNSSQGVLIGGGELSDVNMTNNIYKGNGTAFACIIALCNNVTIQHSLFDHNNGPAYVSGVGVGVAIAGLFNSTVDSNAFVGQQFADFIIPTGLAIGCDITITNNTSTGDATFVSIGSTAQVYIANNTIKNATDDAIVLEGSTGDVEITGNNFISGNGAGVATDSYGDSNDGAWVHGNTFNMNAYGIHVYAYSLSDGSYGSSMGVYANTFKASKVAAIQVDNDVDTSGLEVNDNYIQGNFAGLITDPYNAAFDATCNWWGTNAGPRSANNPGGYGDSVSGLVLNNGGEGDIVGFQPWLTSSNLNFPCDTSAPTISISSPTAKNYSLHQSVRPMFSCSDTGGSGIASCTVTAGGSNYALNTSTAGAALPFTVTAVDKAGNTTTDTVYYSVGNP